ncbi:MAG: IS200/IS605 family transposase [Euryarchaeota archaeon]|nr:IS200/IS605 family transposase [Euryarchaeota archaeon]
MKLRRDRHSTSMLADHPVFCPKYRGAVLRPGIREYARNAILKICGEMGLEVTRMAIGAEHVHIFYRYPPRYSVSEIAKKIKGRSSRLLRERFPELKTWCKDGLWSPGSFHGSVGHGAEVVEKYIESQEGLTTGERIESLRRG